MINDVKKMKNIIHDLDSSEYICKNNSTKANLNCNISSNEDIKQSLNFSKSTNCSKNCNISLKEEEKINDNKNKIIIPKKVENERNLQEINKSSEEIYITEKISTKNYFIINNEIFKDNCCIDWLNNINDIMSSTVDFSLKDENINENNNSFNLENNNSPFQKMPNFVDKDIKFSLKYKKDEFYLNNINNEKNYEDENDEEENEDCCSNMTNLYLQDYCDKKGLISF